MSNAIQFLETLGRSPALNFSSPGAYAKAIGELGVDEQERNAWLSLDMPALGTLLNARSTMFCMITTPDEAPIQMPDDQDDEGEPDSEPDSDDETSK